MLLPLTPLLLLAGDYPRLAAWMPLVSMVRHMHACAQHLHTHTKAYHLQINTNAARGPRIDTHLVRLDVYPPRKY